MLVLPHWTPARGLTVETTGALPPELIVLRAVEVLRRKLTDIQTSLRPAQQQMEMETGVGVNG